jgi:small Trp-rich protein
MYFLVLGVALIVMKYLEIGPIAVWSWLWVLSPFALAVVWWVWADSSGYTKRKAMERENEKREARIERNKEAIGTSTRKRR